MDSLTRAVSYVAEGNSQVQQNNTQNVEEEIDMYIFFLKSILNQQSIDLFS